MKFNMSKTIIQIKFIQENKYLICQEWIHNGKISKIYN